MHSHYFRVKSAFLEWQMAQSVLKAQADQAKAKFEAELVASGLDPAKTYQLNEAEQDIVESDRERTAES